MNQLYQDLKAMTQESRLYLWGAGQQGRGLQQRLAAAGVLAEAFVDRNFAQIPGGRVLGLPVLDPETVLAEALSAAPPILVITPFFSQESLLAGAEARGFKRGQNLFAASDLSPYNYTIDVSGACNLRCLACPRGEGRPPGPPKGFMSAEDFGRVVEKIRREDPLAAALQLYQWGEPLLNRHLPEMISLAAEAGFASAISSNLSGQADLRPIIAAGPSWFRASLSGFGPGYELTHTGGRWPLFLKNLKTLARLKDELNPAMKVEVFYHLYRHNQGEELARAKSLCRDLGFEFDPVWAYLISLDEVRDLREGLPLSPQALKAKSMLALSTENALEKADQERDKPCLVRNVIPINWDLSVSHCMMFYRRPGNLAAENFLETPLEEIQVMRRNPLLCRQCQALSLHRYCQVYNTWPTDLPLAAPC